MVIMVEVPTLWQKRDDSNGGMVTMVVAVSVATTAMIMETVTMIMVVKARLMAIC